MAGCSTVWFVVMGFKSTLGRVFINPTIDGATTKPKAKTNPGKGVINLCGTFKA